MGTYGSGGRTHEDVLISFIGDRVHNRLDAVEGGVRLEGSAAKSVHLGKCDDLFSCTSRRLLGDWDGNLFVVLKVQCVKNKTLVVRIANILSQSDILP